MFPWKCAQHELCSWENSACLQGSLESCLRLMTVGQWLHHRPNFCSYCVIWWHHKTNHKKSAQCSSFHRFPIKIRDGAPRIHYASQQYKLHGLVFSTHSFSSDSERVLKVFFGSSFILLLDRFLNRKEENERRKTNHVSRPSKIHRSLFQDFLIVTAAGRQDEHLKIILRQQMV